MRFLCRSNVIFVRSYDRRLLAFFKQVFKQDMLDTLVGWPAHGRERQDYMCLSHLKPAQSYWGINAGQACLDATVREVLVP
jgi:hypothetical protein